MNQKILTDRIYQTILELATEEGINASGKGDVYGCIFGRDSAISILKILKAISNANAVSAVDTDLLLVICRRALITLTDLQGKETNVESGEQPGKFIHEYRKNNYERLLTLDGKPWYVYPDGILRNYDSLDSTPLALIAIYRYWQMTNDSEFLLRVLPNVEAGLNWIITYADMDKDQLVEYELPEIRRHGGLVVQSWMDSKESVTDHLGNFPKYPIAPVEVQGYTWLALKLWADFYDDTNNTFAHTKKFARKLRQQANAMKKRFNEIFLFENEGILFPAQALDGYKNQLKTVTGNPILLLWAAYKKYGKTISILEEDLIPGLVKRSFMDDMFEADAGIRTMSTKSLTYSATDKSYHNGSFWPKLNGMAHEGLMSFGYMGEAGKLKDATLLPIAHFGSPIELYMKHELEKYVLYNDNGQKSCRNQAWSAAVALDLLTL